MATTPKYHGSKQILFALLLVPLSLPAIGSSYVALAQEETSPLPIDKLLSIGSVVGRDMVQWSPDGEQITFSSGLGGGGLMAVSPESGFPVRIPIDLGGAGHFLASQMPTWSPDGRWIAYVSTKSGSQEIWLWSARSGRDSPLTKLGGRINSYTWSPDSRWIAFSNDRYGNYDIWKVELASGDSYRLTENDRYEVFPTWTPDAGSILFVELDERWTEHTVIEMTSAGSGRRTVVQDTDFFDYRAGGTFGYPAVSPDGTTVLFRSHRSGWINYWTVPLAGGNPQPVAAEAADQSHARWSPDGRHIAYVSNHNGTHELRVVRVGDGGQPRTLVAPGTGVVAVPEWSPDGTRISYTLGTPTRPDDLFVVEVSTGATKQLTVSTFAGNIEQQLVAPEKIAYPSTDDLTINAYLYAPPGSERGERYPAVLWIHGGPTSQFNDTFQARVQFFVQRGYVVLLPNIRGSSGYGKAFEDANNGCWGHCDLEDVLAGVDYLKALPYVNPDKIGITGTSYGGCMSMAAVAFAPGVFQAAIPSSGYADWIHFVGEQELRHLKLLDYEFGPLAENEAVYRANSPMFSVANVTTPTFLVHGKGFFPESQASENFAVALERHYKVFRHKAYPNENYYVRSRENVRQLLLDMLQFFDEFLKDTVVERRAPPAGPR
jgi:dipeptidyl aminopeptidase/acylaminoacyl peptidase